MEPGKMVLQLVAPQIIQVYNNQFCTAEINADCIVISLGKSLW